jgi:hypothetical protein
MLEKRHAPAVRAEVLKRLWQLDQARNVGTEVIDRLAP